VVSAITRCAATQVKPSPAERDLDIVGTLRTFGHNLMGVYGEVLHAGEMAVGDPITVANTYRSMNSIQFGIAPIGYCLSGFSAPLCGSMV
jgi:uncharacterized protein YcbX